MNGMAEGAFALRNAEEAFGVTAMSDFDLMETAGGMVWWIPVAAGGAAALAGVAVGVLIYALVN